MSMFRVMGQLGLDGANFFGTLGRAQTAMNRFGNSITRGVGNRLAAAFSVGAITMFAKSTMELAGSLVDMHKRTGASIEFLQRMNRATQDNSTSMQALVAFWEQLAVARGKALKEPGGADALAFKKFGISQSDLRSMGSEELTRKIALSFQGDSNVENLTASLREIGGKGAGEMVAVFRSGLDQMYQDIVVMTGETAEALDDLDDSFAQLKITMQTMFAPFLAGVLDFINKGLTGWKAIYNGLSAVKEAFSGVGFLDFLRGRFGQGESVASVSEIFGDAFTETLGAGVVDEIVRKSAKKDPKALDFSDIVGGTESKPKKMTGHAPYSDALVSIGNFLGTNQTSVGRVAERQLEVLTRIERNTRRSGVATSGWGPEAGPATSSWADGFSAE